MLNPFVNIFETKMYPHARTLRTSLGQKLKDCMKILASNLFVDEKRSHIGIFDFLTLGIPVLALFCLKHQKNRFNATNNPVSTLFSAASVAVLGIIVFTLFIARWIFTVAVTLAVSPIIVCVHLCGRFLSRSIRNEALQLKGSIEGRDCTLRQFLIEKQISLDEIQSEIIAPSLLTNINLDLDRQKVLQLYSGASKFEVDSKDKNQYRFLSALAKLNIGSIQNAREENSNQNDLFKEISINPT